MNSGYITDSMLSASSGDARQARPAADPGENKSHVSIACEIAVLVNETLAYIDYRALSHKH